MEAHKKYIERAVELSRQSVLSGGGPFGAVIVKEGRIIGEGANSVTLDNDPTAHAEVNAIRQACKAAGKFSLEGAVIYTSCEPCPMCLGAIYWARISKIYYANTRSDAARIGFDDSFIYEEIPLPYHQRSIGIDCLPCEQAQEVFNMWENSDTKTEY